MKPTPRLRWVPREYETVADPSFYGVQPRIIMTTNVLQQWWAEYNNWAEVSGEWRDVPIEKETA